MPVTKLTPTPTRHPQEEAAKARFLETVLEDLAHHRQSQHHGQPDQLIKLGPSFRIRARR